MARVSVSYICQQCGSTFPKWAGKCDDCGAWNTLVEERKDATAGPSKQAFGRRVALEPLQSAKAAALVLYTSLLGFFLINPRMTRV